MVNSTPLQKYDSQVQQKSKHTSNTKPYELRDRVWTKNWIEESDGDINVKAMCRLLCKPVSINIKKLSVSELNVLTKSKSYSEKLQGPLIQDEKHSARNKSKKKKESNSGHISAMQHVAFPKVKEPDIGKKHIQGLPGGIKQPYIKLYRVDELVNKVAQTSVKTVSNKKCEMCMDFEYIEKSKINLNEPNRSDIYVNNKGKRMSSDSINHCDLVNKGSDTYLIMQETKRLKLNSSESAEDIYISKKVHSATESKCISKSRTAKLNHSANMTQENASKFKDMLLTSANSYNVNSSNEKGNPSICAIPQLNLTCIDQDKAGNTEIQKPMQQLNPLHKAIKKFKILKEIRVLLVRVDSSFNMLCKQSRQQRKANIEVPSTCNVSGDSENISENNYKQNIIRGLKQTSVHIKEPVDIWNTTVTNTYGLNERMSETLQSKTNAVKHFNLGVPEEITNTTYKDILPGYSSRICQQKRRKSIDVINTKNTDYKCIICDQHFTHYSNLQQHLKKHARKHYKNALKLPEHSLLFSKELQQTKCNLNASEMLDAPQLFAVSTNETTGTAERLSNEDKTEKDIQNDDLLDSYKCNIICVHALSNNVDKKCFDHAISNNVDKKCFDHAMDELPRVSQLQKQNLDAGMEGANKISPKLRTMVTVDQNSIVNSVLEESSIVVKNEEESFTKNFENTNVESTTLSKNTSNVHLTSNINLKTQKKKDTVSVKRIFNVCNCHNITDRNIKCLQIEIVLLCRICKVLFRTMECFEIHYRFPEYAACNANRLNGRCSKLFCTSCGMMFSSIQAVRHHLEIHARFNRNCTMEFRCNVCKVLFIGVGSLFYIHWSTHVRDPFWIASKQSFPKNSTRISNSINVNMSNEIAKMSNISIEGYILVAEHVCQNCKLPFITHNDMKLHVTLCNKQHLGKGVIVSPKSKANVQTYLPPLPVVKKPNGIFRTQGQTIDNTNELGSTIPNSDKENLIRILEGNDDSGYELQIDLTGPFEEFDKEEEGIEQIQKAIKGVSDATVVGNLKSFASTMVNKSEKNTNGIICTQNIEETSQYITQNAVVSSCQCPTTPAVPISAHDKSLNSQTNAGVSQVLCQNSFMPVKEEMLEELSIEQTENIQSYVVNDGALGKNAKELSAPMVVTKNKQENPQNSKIGYLRVRSLEELVDQTQIHKNCNTPIVSDHASLVQSIPSEQCANYAPETKNSKESLENLKKNPVLFSNLRKPSLTTSNVSNQRQRLIDKRIIESNIAILNEKSRQLRSNLNGNTHSDSTQKNAILKPCRSVFVKSPNITRNSYVSTITNSNKSNEITPAVGNFPIAVHTSLPNYCNNIIVPDRELSLIVNQSAPSVQNVATVNMSQLPTNQQIYQAPVFNAPLTLINSQKPMQPQVYLMWPNTYSHM